ILILNAHDVFRAQDDDMPRAGVGIAKEMSKVLGHNAKSSEGNCEINEKSCGMSLKTGAASRCRSNQSFRFIIDRFP
ncbi:hypothetical protein KQX54_000279, partial [Cotesia glomerata]